MENECHIPALKENDYSSDDRDPFGQSFYGRSIDIRGVRTNWRHYPKKKCAFSTLILYLHHRSIFTLFFLLYSRILRLICVIWEWDSNSGLVR